MGWEVLGMVQIDIGGSIDNTTLEKIKSIVTNEGGFNPGYEPTQVWFTVSGNKGVDYDFMDGIIKLLKECNTVNLFEISSNEYCESGDGGFYYNSEDEEELEGEEQENYAKRGVEPGGMPNNEIGGR